MLLLSLLGGAGSEVVALASPTKAEGLQVSGSGRESDFSFFHLHFCLFMLTTPIYYTNLS